MDKKYLCQQMISLTLMLGAEFTKSEDKTGEDLVDNVYYAILDLLDHLNCIEGS